MMAEASLDAPANAADKAPLAGTSDAPAETAATESAPEASQVSLYACFILLLVTGINQAKCCRRLLSVPHLLQQKRAAH